MLKLLDTVIITCILVKTLAIKHYIDERKCVVSLLFLVVYAYWLVERKSRRAVREGSLFH